MTRQNLFFMVGLVAGTVAVLGWNATETQTQETPIYAQVGGASCWDGGGCLLMAQAQVQEYATFGAGCFADLSTAFQDIDGVTRIEAGYMVVGEKRVLAEVVRLKFDPKQVAYRELLATFYRSHRPTDAQGQGQLAGSRYQPRVFTHSDAQHHVAIRYRSLLNASGRYMRHITTTEHPAGPFQRLSLTAHSCVKRMPANASTSLNGREARGGKPEPATRASSSHSANQQHSQQ